MSRTIGLFVYRTRHADFLWNQCDGVGGLHGDLKIRGNDARADHVLCLGPPMSPDGAPRFGSLRRRISKWRGSYERDRARQVFGGLNRSPADVTVLFYEPPGVFADEWYEVAAQHAVRVYGPDPRCPRPVVLPTLWTIEDHVATLRAEAPPNGLDRRPFRLGCVTSGVRFLPGHDSRFAFFARLRAAGVPLELFGRGLPESLASGGPVQSKASVLRASEYALVVENHADGAQYITEKLWDAILCWSVPIYFGSDAIDGLLPAGSFVRLPDLKDAGVDAVKRTLAEGETARLARMPALAEARRRAMNELRLIEWFRRLDG